MYRKLTVVTLVVLMILCNFSAVAEAMDCDNPYDWTYNIITVTTCRTATVRMPTSDGVEVVGKIPKGTRVDLMALLPKNGNLWAEIIINYCGTYDVGYILARDIEGAKKLPKLTGKVTVKAIKATVREEAANDSEQIGVVKKGNSFNVNCYLFDSEGRPWVSIEKQGQIGYIPWNMVKAS